MILLKLRFTDRDDRDVIFTPDDLRIRYVDLDDVWVDLDDQGVDE